MSIRGSIISWFSEQDVPSRPQVQCKSCSCEIPEVGRQTVNSQSSPNRCLYHRIDWKAFYLFKVFFFFSRLWLLLLLLVWTIF